MDVLKIVSIERRLYGPDVIPWTSLLTESALAQLRERYKFRGIAQEQSSQGVLMRLSGVTGEYSADGKSQAIEQLIIEPALMHVQIGGESETADSFLESLASFLSEIRPVSDFSRELTRSYQTIATAKLRVPFDALFSKELHNYLNRIVKPKVKLAKAEPEITLEHLSWSVRYRMETTDFSYAPKAITLEPRQGSPASEMLYYTQSPTKSKEHLALIAEFEKTFA
jgi:hypothetical protein